MIYRHAYKMTVYNTQDTKDLNFFDHERLVHVYGNPVSVEYLGENVKNKNIYNWCIERDDIIVQTFRHWWFANKIDKIEFIMRFVE